MMREEETMMQQWQQRIDVTIFQRDARWRPISTSLLDFLCDFFPTSSSHVSSAVSTSEAIGEDDDTDIFLRSFSIRGSEGRKISFLQDP